MSRTVIIVAMTIEAQKSRPAVPSLSSFTAEPAGRGND
jgi:hypothetical protein